jgi:hypothetical protein
MSLTPDDRAYFDGKFDSLHDRITKHALEDERMFGNIAASMHQTMAVHKETDHNWGKLFAVLSSVVVVAAAVIGGVLWLIEKANGKV